MHTEVTTLLAGASSARGLVVIIDAFRAFTTACHGAAASPGSYVLVGDSSTAARLAAYRPRPLLVGKAELGASLGYDVPNSPTLLRAHLLRNRTIIHRTGAGARGILQATAADEVIAASFVNAAAIARYIRLQAPTRVTLVAMGHEGTSPTLEDALCAKAIQADLLGQPFDLGPWLQPLREGSGRYFFEGAQEEYPRADFDECTALDRFSFVLRAEVHGDYAELIRVDC
ncbi:MAG: 2-phosphosulfolactate phosphatase [Nannocystis sp.]|nr:2-phosphosulfolactate phosphatase [Nannocystis sp.]